MRVKIWSRAPKKFFAQKHAFLGASGVFLVCAHQKNFFACFCTVSLGDMCAVKIGARGRRVKKCVFDPFLLCKFGRCGARMLLGVARVFN